MRRYFRPVAVLGLAGLIGSLAGVQLAINAHEDVDLFAGPSFEYSAGVQLSAYDLAKLKVLEPTLYHVEESYVEPDRLDWEEMYRSGLEAVERKTPGFKFTRTKEAERVSLEIGEFSTVLEVEAIGSSRQLQFELRRVASLLQEHLAADGFLAEGREDAQADIEYTLVNGVLNTLDPHSMLLPPEDASEMDVENQGQFGGLGVTIVEQDGGLMIENTLPGTPAERSGIQAHDRITRISGQSTMNMSLDEAVQLLRGPVGASITIEIMRSDFEEPKSLSIERELIKLNEVAGVLLEGDIGLVRIQTFHRHVESELHAQLARLRRESAEGHLRGMILDLRDNPGGYLNQAVAVADTFLDHGEIVSTVDGVGRRKDVKHARRTPTTEPPYPMAVLLNANSASASEIVAGALRNNERAVIIGERSFGKGSVQDLHQFYDTSKLKLTISQYLTPGDRSIQTVGIPADIELQPLRLDPTLNNDGTVARVYWRERVRREADLDKRLDRSVRSHDLASETAYSFHYLDRSKRNTSRPLDTTDYPIAFARELLNAEGHARRPEMLARAGRVVDQSARRADAAIMEGFEEVGIDWRDGVGHSRPGSLPLIAKLDVGADGVIDAGVREKLTLTLTNTSDAPLWRVGAMALEHDVLAGREFVFGYLGPGESKSFSTWVNLVDGYPSHEGELVLSIRDGESEPLGELRVPITVRGRDLPDFDWEVVASEVKGNGDGRPSQGEIIGLDVTLHNRGKGMTAAAFVRLKNGSGTAVDLIEASLEPGELRDSSGKRCTELSRREGCQYRVLAGESWTGQLTFELKEAMEEGWKLDLLIGDDEAYDHASVVVAGLHEHFSQKQRVLLSPNASLGTLGRSEPPTIEISRAPAATTEHSRVTISGKVTDDVGIRHVMVFAAGDKLFYQGELGGVRSVPFTADVLLEPGTNIITVVAQDDDGFTHTRSIVTEGPPSEAISRVVE